MTTTDTEAISEHQFGIQFADRVPTLLPLVAPARHRVFLNHVDSYHSKHIASYLVDQIAGRVAEAEVGGEDDEEAEGEEEEDEEKEQKETAARPITAAENYQVIGTLSSSFRKKSEDVSYTVNEDSPTFYDEILGCRTVVYDISEDPNEIPKALNALHKIVEEIEKIEQIGPKTFQNYQELRVFILISTVMTWGNTKPIDPEDPDTPFNESDFKKRKPHPNYKEHIACEREVVLQGRKFKTKLRTYVVCAGIIYGEEEGELSFLFKMAWSNEEYLPVLLPGTNRIPLIHISDLAKVIHGLAEKTPKTPQFILAVEQTPCNLKQIIKALTKTMGTGRWKEIPKEDAFAYPDITQEMFERLTVNLTMEPTYITEELEIEWKNEMNLAENMKGIVTEFRKARKLLPTRFLIHGPPAVGKTTLAKKLAEIYGVVHLTPKIVIENTLKDMRSRILDEKEKSKPKADKPKPESDDEGAEEEEEEEGEEEEDEGVDAADLQEQIREIEGAMENSEDKKLPDAMLIKLLKRELAANRCFNQGYVLDGFPKTMEQTRALFGGGAGGRTDEAGGEEEAEEEAEGEEEEEEQQEGGVQIKSSILPDYVITLYATDDFICKRIMQLPEKDIQETNYTEENMLRRLADYHRDNTEDNTMLNYFDEIEIHPLVVDAMGESAEAVESQVLPRIGPPAEFVPTAHDEERRQACAEQRRRLEAEQARLERDALEQRARLEHEDKTAGWLASLERLQMEEERLVVAQSEPLRNYLVRFVFPTLTRGLMELARVKPFDPVDFLAEYLFKENPEGHMFDPSYTRDGAAVTEVQVADVVPDSAEGSMYSGNRRLSA